MLFHLLTFLNLLILILPSETVTCYADPDITLNITCEGDICVTHRRQVSIGHNIFFRTCVAGIKKPANTCFISYSDEMLCYCDTDFCNTDTVFRSNFTSLPIVECKEVRMKEYVATASNKCVRRLNYFAAVEFPRDAYLHEFAEGDRGAASFDFIFTSDSLLKDKVWTNFFSDACYNISLHPAHYMVYCRCTQANCNTPEKLSLPYPIAPPTVTCFTSGMDFDYDKSKFGKEKDGEFHVEVDYLKLIRNESFVDKGYSCRGHFCFIASTDYGEFGKGCISANEQGEYKIQLGYSYLNNIPFYICNTDFCNSNIQNALEEAKNSSLAVRDNGADEEKCLLTLIYVVVSLLLTS